MNIHAPRRVKDLLAFGPDANEESNSMPSRPQKAEDETKKKKLETVDNGNKENNVQQGPSRAAFDMLPRRRSEMTDILDSESEDENKSDHNLNCAILNDSFVLSPIHEITTSTSSLPSSAAGVLKASNSNLSFLGRFGEMGIDCSSNTNTSSHLQMEEQKKPIIRKLPATLQLIADKRKDVSSETPLRSASVTAASKSHPKHDVEFVTPQVCSIDSRQGARTQTSQQTRNNVEFRAQKVLFQTPMTVSRAPFNSDSISFSLCDTISESPDTPAQPTPKPVLPSDKIKKSLENVFRRAEPVELAKSAAPVKSIASAKPVTPPKHLAAPSTIAAVTNKPDTVVKSNSNVLKINNHSYVIIKKLGCGGSSSVYLARREDTGQEFALKEVDLQADPVVVQGYLNETKLLEKLQGNVCVVSLYDYQLLRQESKLYMVMEKGECDLNKILQRFSTNIPLYNLMNIVYQMLQAVNYIHQHGVIHSDLKPANFLMSNGRLKLIDFGIASNIAVDSTSIIKFSQAGTFNYISPEALTDISSGTSPMRAADQPKIKISTKSDVWSLGCILYLLIYQKTPFGHIRNIHAKMSAIASPSTSIEYPALPIFYPIMLLHMVKNCLQLNPKKRPSCIELLKYPFHMVIPLQNLQLESKP